MSRIKPVPREQLVELEPMLQQLEEGFGFVPNDYLAMAHQPMIMKSVVEWTSALMFGEGSLPMPLRIMITYVASKSYGCMYCTSHCISLGTNAGIPFEKIENIDDFETNEHFTDAERAALRLARNANQQPNAATDADFDALRSHYDQGGIVEIMSLISMMAFYTKWNDTMNTIVEGPAYEASSKLSWYEAGKHSPKVSI